MSDHCGRNRQHCHAKVFHMCVYHPSRASARRVQRTCTKKQVRKQHFPHSIFLLQRGPVNRKQGPPAPIGGGVLDYAGEAGVAGHSLSAEEAWTGCGLTLRSEKFQRCARTRMVRAGDCGVRPLVGEQRHVATVARITTAISQALAGRITQPFARSDKAIRIVAIITSCRSFTGIRTSLDLRPDYFQTKWVPDRR
jgi:hypothetical protein